MATPTENFAIGRFEAHSNPGAPALNANWTLIDALLAKALRFSFFWSGTLEIGQGQLISAERPPKGVTLRKKLLRVVIRDEAPTGRSAKFAFYKNGVEVGQVEILAGEKYGETLLDDAVEFTDVDEATMDTIQVGTSHAGATATGYMEAA